MSRILKMTRVFILLMGLGLANCVPFLSETPVVPEVEMASTATKPLQIASSPSSMSTPVTTQQPKESNEIDQLQGIGIMGDLFYDEYQADDQRGGDFHAVTFNLVEILERTRDFNLGPWGTWGEPRRTGYEYNWARSGATS